MDMGLVWDADHVKNAPPPQEAKAGRSRSDMASAPQVSTTRDDLVSSHRHTRSHQRVLVGCRKQLKSPGGVGSGGTGTKKGFGNYERITK